MTTTTRDLYEELLPLLIDPLPPKNDQRVWSFCPSHPDGTKHGKRSLSLSPKYGLQCFAGCNFLTVLTALRERSGIRPSGVASHNATADSLVAVYQYTDISGHIVAEHGRFERTPGQKTFLWRLPDGEWRDGLKGMALTEVPLYNAPLVLQRPSEPVYFVEGEKATDACVKHGLLAVTLPQGASGALPSLSQLGILSGRDIHLWPDNDPPGQELMTKLQAILRTIARSTSYVSTPINLPEKGDAFDYFRLGGTVEALGGMNATEAIIEYKAQDNVLLHLPTAKGLIHFDFEAIEKRRYNFETELSISLNSHSQEPFSQRINLLSSSARTDLRRDLDAVYGKDWNWTALLNKAFQELRKSYAAVDPAIDAATMEVVPGAELFLVEPMLPFGSPTILFGDGGSFKTYFAIALAIHCAIGRDWFGATTPCMPVIYVDYEGNAQSFAFRCKRLLAGLSIDDLPFESLFYWSGRGMPFRDHIDALHRKIHDTGASLVIVDTIGPACGGEPEKAEVALDYFRALSKLGVTTLSLAHVTKAGENKYPFGSVYWHNEARRTFYIERVQEEELPDLDIGLYCRKVNDGPKPRPVAFSVHLEDPYGPVTMRSTHIGDVPQLAQHLPGQQRVWNTLTEPMYVADIAESTELSKQAVVKILTEHPKLFLKLIRQPDENSGQNKNRGKPPQLWARRHNE